MGMRIVVLLLVLTSFLSAYFYSESVNVQSKTPPIEVVPTPTDIPEALNTSENILAHVQDYRNKNGKSLYIQSDFLCSIAEKRIEVIKSDWSHNGFLNTKYCDNCTLGENLARNYLFADQTVNSWLDSPTHKANLDRNFTHTCIATDGNYVVQIFGYY